MKADSITPTRLRLILSTTLLLIVGIGIALFYIANSQLVTVAATVRQTESDASASRNNIATLQAIQNELDKQKSAIALANNVAADSQSYNYQNQIISDLNTYAGRAAVTITNIDFPATSGAGSAAPSTAPAATTLSGSAGAPLAAPAGLSTATVSVTIKNPVSYTHLLTFFNMIEQSVPKLQISKVNLTKSAAGGTDSISSDVLTIEVYVR
jgi:hypothetical protein